MDEEFTLSTVIPTKLNENFEVAASRRHMKKKVAVAEALQDWIIKDDVAESGPPAQTSHTDTLKTGDRQLPLSAHTTESAAGLLTAIESAVHILRSALGAYHHGEKPPSSHANDPKAVDKAGKVARALRSRKSADRRTGSV